MKETRTYCDYCGETISIFASYRKIKRMGIFTLPKETEMCQKCWDEMYKPWVTKKLEANGWKVEPQTDCAWK